MEILQQLLTPEFLILALFLNIAIKLIRDSIEGFLTKGKSPAPDFGVAGFIFRNIILVALMSISFGSTWLLCKYKFIAMFADSLFLTSAWSSVLSILMYEIGVKEIMDAVKNLLKKKLEVDNPPAPANTIPAVQPYPPVTQPTLPTNPTPPVDLPK